MPLVFLLLLGLQTNTIHAPSPRPIEPGSWVQAEDYPQEAARFGIEGTVGFALAINAQGKITNCEILQSADAELDAATCRVLAKRARFQVARDASGKAVDSTYRSRITWTVPQDPPVPFAPARRFVESWTPISGGPVSCHVLEHGELPWPVATQSCPPGAANAARPANGRVITLRTATTFLPSDRPGPFPAKMEGRVTHHVRLSLEVDSRGVVVRCDAVGRRPERTAHWGDTCELLSRHGKVMFEPTAPGMPPRRGVLEYKATTQVPR